MCAIVLLDSECAHQPGHFELLKSPIGPSAHISPLSNATLSAYRRSTLCSPRGEEGGGGVWKSLTLADKGGRGIRQMLALANKGWRGVRVIHWQKYFRLGKNIVFKKNYLDILIKLVNYRIFFKTRWGSPVDHRPSTAEAPPIGKNHTFSKIAVTL